MVNPQNYAISLEQIVRKQWGGLDRSEFGGIINAAIFRREPLLACYLALAPMYIKNEKRNEINDFIGALAVENVCIDEMKEETIQSFVRQLKDILQ